jgi:hypothetical protein
MIRKMMALFCVLTFSTCLQAQKDSAQLLKEPANWTFEQFPLPPSFAASIPYKGIEELRFSPGMFHKDSVTYFTYAFAARLDNTPGVKQDDIRNYLLAYFKGLCSSTASARKLVVDTGKITVSVTKKTNTDHALIYNAILHIFGVFADGAPVTLNMEIKVLQDPPAIKTYLIFIASPLDKTGQVWAELYKIQRDFMIPPL